MSSSYARMDIYRDFAEFSRIKNWSIEEFEKSGNPIMEQILVSKTKKQQSKTAWAENKTRAKGTSSVEMKLLVKQSWAFWMSSIHQRLPNPGIYQGKRVESESTFVVSNVWINRHQSGIVYAGSRSGQVRLLRGLRNLRRHLIGQALLGVVAAETLIVEFRENQKKRRGQTIFQFVKTLILECCPMTK